MCVRSVIKGQTLDVACGTTVPFIVKKIGMDHKFEPEFEIKDNGKWPCIRFDCKFKLEMKP